MSKRMPKLEREVHLDAPVDLQQPELHGFIALESTQVRLTAVYWDTHERLLGWGHTVRYDASLCFGLEPTPRSISHWFTVAPMTSA